MAVIVVFCATTFASECINCVCTSQQEAKKEMKCCSREKEKSCCEKKENKCSTENKKDCDNCMKCVVKKNDIENPITTSDNKITSSKTNQISEINLSLNPVNPGLISFNTWRLPDKTSKIFLVLSNFRI